MVRIFRTLKFRTSSPWIAALLWSIFLTLNFNTVSQANTVEVIGNGIVDHDRVEGPRRGRLNFDPLISGTHTISINWEGSADIRFSVFQLVDQPATNNRVRLATVNGGGSPAVWTGSLDFQEQYFLSVWSASGAANFNASIEADTENGLPLDIISQPADRTVSEGSDATFTVSATGSGVLEYQWIADGTEMRGETDDTLTVFSASAFESGTEYQVAVSDGSETISSDVAVLTVNEPVVLGSFSEVADTSTWILDGPAPTLDYQADDDTAAFGQVLLRIDDVLLVGGDFTGVRRNRVSSTTPRPFLAAFNAVSGQPISTFQVPFQVDSVVRALALSPNGNQVYVGGDFGLLALDAKTGELELDISVENGDRLGRVFDIAVTNTHVYLGGEFRAVQDRSVAHVARLTLDGDLDMSWRPRVRGGRLLGRSAPVQSVAVSHTGNEVYIGGTFRFINGIEVPETRRGRKVSLLSVSALDGTVQPETFAPDIGNSSRNLTAYDIAVTEFYVIVAWGGPNYLSFHSPSGDRLRQYETNGDVQALQVVGDHVFVGHHGDFFEEEDSSDQIPPESDEDDTPFKMHSFRIDDPSFLPEQAWVIRGAFGVWGISASEDSLWLAGQIWRAGTNERAVDGLVRFPALD